MFEVAVFELVAECRGTRGSEQALYSLLPPTGLAKRRLSRPARPESIKARPLGGRSREQGDPRRPILCVRC